MLDRRQLLNPAIKDTGNDNEFVFSSSTAGPGLGVDILRPGIARGYRGTVDSLTNEINFGSVNAWAWNTDSGRFFPRSGTTWAPPASATSVGILTNDVEPTSSATFDEHPTVRYRVPALAVEVTNTTASIYKQGTVTSVRIPAGHYLENTCGVADRVGSTPFPWRLAGTATGHYGSYPETIYDTFVFPPDTIDSAVLSGGLQRAAETGAYSVTACDLEHCTLQRDTLRYCAFGDGNIKAASDNNGIAFANAYADLSSEIDPPNSTATIGAVKCGVPALQHFTNRDTIAIYFTGLSNQTTLNVAICALVEIAPVDYDVDYRSLVPLKRVPPAENEHILDLYRNLMSTMPSSVPVAMNPLGEWFAKVVEGIKKGIGFAAQHLAPLMGPEAEAVGAIAQKVLGLTNKVGEVQRSVQKVAGQVGGVKSAEQKKKMIKKKKKKTQQTVRTRNARG